VPKELLSTQMTMQNVEILAVGAPAGDEPAPNAQTQASRQAQRTITFLLDHQDAVTLKFVKDSGGTMDLVVRSPEDPEQIFQRAVWRMLPHNKLGRDMLKRMKVYAGPTHPHTAQAPKPLNKNWVAGEKAGVGLAGK
jgi:hypothetical protein